MMLDIPAAIEDVVEVERGHMSVVRIETTHPVYLVFDSNTTFPRWVVRFGPESLVTASHAVLSTLHGVRPDLVPQPLVCRAWHGGEWMQVQTGLAGRPWFQFQQDLSTASQWQAAMDMALQALADMQVAIRMNDRWNVDVDVPSGLAAAGAALETIGMSTPAIGRALKRAMQDGDVGRVRWFVQHGDFCFNNLLLADRARIVDFDEFGLTAMPLHDEFSLALSFQDMAPAAVGGRFREHLEVLLGRHAINWHRHLWPLWLHHLAWRVVTHSRLENRRGTVDGWNSLLRHSAELAESPDRDGFRALESIVTVAGGANRI